MADTIFDIAVVGGGPAGLSAALTGRVRNKNVALFEHLEFSPKLQKAHLVDNYPGLPQITGKGLVQQMAAHCLAHNPTVIKEKVLNIFPGEIITLLTPVATYQARTVILTTGVVATLLFSGEKEFLGRGVSYCATCDGMFYKDKKVAVISYSSEGEHETQFLGELCREVYYLPQYKSAQPPALRGNVKVLAAKPRAIKGDSQVEQLVTDQDDIKVDGVFIFRESDPVENILAGLELTGEVVKVDRAMATNIPGIFAAGDCTGKPWQIAKATGEGLVAVLSAISYLDTKARPAAP
ncbi:MAG: NAD(P)/FAD-dependent oxidoreductase [Negativicutes bacterium]|nr:NAD(P)/FAD-dependent oxidoreductase [Negativicutes bacterium]